MKTYEYISPYDSSRHTVELKPVAYSDNEHFGLMLLENGSLYATVTVNLPESTFFERNIQFVDENNMPGIGKWLEDNGIATNTGYAAQSGFCTYPLYEFNIDETLD